jgi:hypothetical protein
MHHAVVSALAAATTIPPWGEIGLITGCPPEEVCPTGPPGCLSFGVIHPHRVESATDRQQRVVCVLSGYAARPVARQRWGALP